MKTYVILLRGVMPTGKNKVPMAELRDRLTRAGLADVRTYIQSGNVIASSELSASDIETLVHEQILKHFGGDIVVIVQTPKQLLQILDENPFKDAETASLYFTLLAKNPSKANADRLRAMDFSPDKFVITKETVYVRVAHGYGVTKINNNFLEKQLGVSATTRNYNTMRKLVELSAAVR